MKNYSSIHKIIKLSVRFSVFLFFLITVVCLSANSAEAKKDKAKPKKYRITYELKKGTNSLKNPVKYLSGEKTKLYKPVRTGYTFEGWYKDSKYKTKIKWISKKQKGDVTLYAKWLPITYKITYKSNGGINNEENVKNYTIKDRVYFYSPFKDNFDFVGWFIDSELTIPIDKIPKGRTGDVTVYAKWSHSALNINGEGTYNMIWSWWYYPNVVSYEETANNLYWTFTTNEGYTGVASYDYKTETTHKTYLKYALSTDDHNGAAVTIMDDGKIMCAYSGGHNSDNEVHIRISDNPEDISSFETDITLESVGKTCYGQIIRSSGKYYIFYRVDNTNWAYRYSEDGYVWSEEVMFILSEMQYYIKAMPTTEDNLIRVCMYSNPAKPDCNIRMGFLNTEDNIFYNSDMETVLGGSNISQTEVDIIIPTEGKLIQRMLDVKITAPEDVKILYATFVKSTTNQKGTYKLYDNGQITDICPTGNAIWKYMYQGGAAFVDDNHIVLAREEAGYDYVEIYRVDETEIIPENEDTDNNISDSNSKDTDSAVDDGTDNDTGDTDPQEEIIRIITITLEETLYSEEIGTLDIRNARPIVDINGRAILWHRGYYDPTSYKNYLTEAKLYHINNVTEDE